MIQVFIPTCGIGIINTKGHVVMQEKDAPVYGDIYWSRIER